MRFLNIKKLKQELRTGSLSENDAFVYFFAMFIVETLVVNSSFAFSDKSEFALLDIANILIPTFIAVTTTWALYLANGGKDGHYFFLRYFSILWVTGVRFLLLVLLSSPIFAVWIWYFVIPGGVYEYEWEALAVANILYAFFYWRVWVHMREVQIGTTT